METKVSDIFQEYSSLRIPLQLTSRQILVVRMESSILGSLYCWCLFMVEDHLYQGTNT